MSKKTIIILCFAAFLVISIINISCASSENVWYTSALKYSEIDDKIVNSGNQSVIKLFKERDKAKSDVIASKFPGEGKILSHLNSKENMQNLVAVVNIMLREFYSDDTVSSVIKMISRNESKYMLKFYSYSYLNNIDYEKLAKFNKDILVLIQNENNENLFGAALPLLIKIDNDQSVAVINEFLSSCSSEAKQNVCAYISVEKKSLLNQLNCQ